MTDYTCWGESELIGELEKKLESSYQKRQLDLQLKMQDAGFNVVTCGMCTRVIIHETGAKELRCPDCFFNSDISDFPDLNY